MSNPYKSVIISSSANLENELLKSLISEFINSSGGSIESLFSARELNDEPKCLLSGDFLCSEVIAKSSIEVIEYFKQATRKLILTFSSLYPVYTNTNVKSLI